MFKLVVSISSTILFLLIVILSIMFVTSEIDCVKPDPDRSEETITLRMRRYSCWNHEVKSKMDLLNDQVEGQIGEGSS